MKKVILSDEQIVLLDCMLNENIDTIDNLYSNTDFVFLKAGYRCIKSLFSDLSDCLNNAEEIK